MKKEFFEKLRNHPQPIVVDFWAPWCAPCRAIGPVVGKISEEYAGRVELWKVNADEQPDLLRSLHIYSIPTLIAFHEGEEVSRQTGAASTTGLSSLFESALSGKKLEQKRPDLIDRFLRLGTGMTLIGLAILSGVSLPGVLLAILGAVILFTAVYDRCPIYRMVSTRLKVFFHRNPASSTDG